MQVEVSLQINLTDTAPVSDTPKLVTMVTAIEPQDWQRWFSQWFYVLQPQHSPIQAYTLSLTLTNDAEIQRLNATYRNCDRPTDVLAFAIQDNTGLPTTIWQSTPLELGDIVISVETAHRQAPQHDHDLQQELVWLASHGLLHLLGWDHPDPPSLQRMLTQQNDLLQCIGFS